MTTPSPANSGKTARLVLIGVLALGLLLIVLMLALTVAQNAPPADTPAPRLTNTPNVGAGGITPVDPGVPVPDVTLPASTGSDVSLSDFHGQFVLLYFGYTHCPDYCPTTMAKWVQVKQGLSEAAQEVAFVMISIDPRRDTPEVIADYLAQFDPAFVGLQANEDAVAALGPVFGLMVKAQGEAEATAEATMDMGGMVMPAHTDEAGVPTYLVDHTIASYLLDREGNLVAIFAPSTPANDIRATVESLMAEAQ